MTNDAIQLQIAISDEQANPEMLDRQTLNLISQLKELEVRSIEYKTESDPTGGTKGDPITIGIIIMSIVTGSIPGAFALLQNWLTDQRKVVIEAPNGAKIEFVPNKKYSQAELLELMDKLNKVPKN